MSAEFATETLDNVNTLVGSALQGAPKSASEGAGAGHSDLELVMDIPVELTVELGRTKIAIGKVMQLAHGSIIELNSTASEPMDIYANGLLIAQGEVVIVEGRFGLRLTDIVTPAERLRRLGRR
jgi:flagellar motor switch protein FliN